MNQKILSKVLATMLVVTLTFANFVLLGVYASNISYGADDTLEKQNIKTNNENVEFDAYFKDENGNKLHSLKHDFDSENQKIYVSVQVKKGYLKSTSILIKGENNSESNFKVVNTEEDYNYIETIDTTNNKLTLKQLDSGTQIILEIPIMALKESNYDLSNFSKINDISLSGSYTGNDGKTVSIEKTIKVKNELTKTVEPVLSQNITKFIPYEVKDQKGTIIQTVVTAGLNNNSLPLNETLLQIEVPTINGEKPDSAWVTVDDDTVKFTEDNWKYDKEEGILTINVKNEALDNKVVWNLDKANEFIIGYKYNEKVDAINAVQKASLNISAYSSEEVQVSTENSLEINQESKLGELVSVDITNSLKEMGKGSLYTKSKKQTEYEENIKVQISNIDLVEKLVIDQNINYFTTNNEETYLYTSANILRTTISKENFEKILGTDGSIIIYTISGEQIGIINNETEVDEQGNYVINYNQGINNIKIVTSKPIAVGTLEFIHTKALNGKTDYTKAEIAKFATLVSDGNAKIYFEETEIGKGYSSTSINLVEPSTQIELSTSTNTLSTVVENKNVEIRVILKTNNISCDLYKNPSIEITLPSYVEKVELTDLKLLFDDELTIKDYTITKNRDGLYVIHINITGEDTKYSSDEVAKGANIVINTNITLKKLTPTKEDLLQARVTNENLTNTETKVKTISKKESVYAESIMKAVAPVGVVVTNSISEYNNAGESVTSISGEEQVGKLETVAESKSAKATINVINNYNNKINNIVILGRIPSSGNKNTITKEDLGSNLNTILNSRIVSTNIDENKVTYYYSENAEATKDVQLESNKWVTNPSNLNNIKSYLILINNYDMATGDSIEFSYGITVPENLPHNLNTYGIYTVYFDNVKGEETISESTTATKVGLTTGVGPELEVKLTPSSNSVEEGKYIEYILSIKNVGKVAAKNVKANGSVVQGDNTAIKLDENVFDSIAVGETATVTYKVKAVAMENEGEEINISATVNADDLEKDIEVTGKTVVSQGYLDVTIETDYTENIRENDEIVYNVEIINANRIQKDNVVVTDVLPEGVTFIKASDGGVYDESSRTVTWNIGTLRSLNMETLFVQVRMNTLGKNETIKTITNKMKIKSDVINSETGETTTREIETEAVTLQITKPLIKATGYVQNEQVEVGDSVIYHLSIKNEGSSEASYIKINSTVPEGLRFEEAQYSIGEITNTTSVGNNNLTIDIPKILAGQTAEVTIKMKAEELEDGNTSKKITNEFTVSARDIEETINLNNLNVTITPRTTVQDPSSGEIIENARRISGVVWIDENKDGKKDANEPRLANVKVTLIDSKTGKIVTDVTTGAKKEQITNENGIYTFSNLLDGIYMVIFEYDTSYYALTTYKKDGVNSDQDSDVVLADAVINGENKKVATTDKISLIANIENIDIGLITNPQFDLSLEKVVSKITVQNNAGNKVVEYKDVRLAKLDLAAKTINSTNIIVEYKLKITNEGGIAGYAKKIVDYIPDGMKFTSELNKDWYQSDAKESGKIYNASLANTLIEPGETKEITLILTKKITEDNLGIINNNAEIYESYNDLGVTDIDSEAGNKSQEEDDLSSADVLVSVKTGEVYMYTTLIIVCVSMLGVGIYLINKKVLWKI